MDRLRNNDIKKIQIKYGIVLVLLVILVALWTSLSLGQKAETFSYPLNCILEEHIHEDTCYEEQIILQCEEEHEHVDECYKTYQQLVCKTYCHQHIAGCFQQKVPEGIEDVNGKVIAYASSQLLQEEQKEDVSVAKMAQPLVVNEEVVVDEVAFTKETVTPINMAQYEYLAELEYYNSETSEWISIKSGDTIPIDAKIRLTYNFAALDINQLNAAKGQAYYVVPDPLRNNIAEGTLVDTNDEVVATLSRGEDQQVLINFDKQWLSEMIDAGTYTLDGKFQLIVDIDPKVVGSDTDYDIQFEKSNVEVSFDEDWQSKRALLEIEKSEPEVIETADGAYFEYQISVTASVDGVDVEDVSVTDLFVANRQYIESYVGVTSNATSLTSNDATIAPVEVKPEDASSGSVYLGKIVSGDVIPSEGSYTDTQAPGTLVWKIGDMKAGETRTLTYQTKIKESLTHTIAIKENKTQIKNQAKAYAKEYLRDSAEAVYTTNNNFTSGCHKKENSIWTDENGIQYVRFRILLEARPSNDFNYNDLRIRDELFPTHGALDVTSQKLKPYLSLVDGSFRLFSGNIPISEYDSEPQLTYADDDLIIDHEAMMFEFNLGEFEPGECITLMYDLKVDKGIYTEVNDDFSIANTFITLNGTDTDANNRLDRYTNIPRFDGKIWSRKMADEDATTSSTTIEIPLGEEVYDRAGVLATNPITSFEVPQGAYRYFIILNEDGKWDLSNATLTDELGEHLRYSGYVKINAYEISNTSFDAEANTNPTVVEDFLKTQPLIKTTWMKIDGLDTFSFHPNEVGHNDRTAYTLEYYALPYNVEDVTSVKVSNTFTLTGDVGDGIGIGGNGIVVDKFVTVTGSKSFAIRKKGWMFEKFVEDDPNNMWNNGRLYWVLEVDGTLEAGRQIRDVIPANQQYYYYESMIGVYVGSLEEGKDWQDYDSVETLEANANLIKLNGIREGQPMSDDVDYTASFYSNREIWVTLTKDITLETDDHLYIVLASQPLKPYVPDYTTLDIETYNNTVYSRENASSGDWVHMIDATYNVSSKGPVYKEFDGTTMVNKDGYIPLGKEGTHSFKDVLWDYVSDSGIYTEWYVNLNWNGEVSGLVEMSDTLPKGMKPVYVRMFEIGSDYDSVGLSLEKPITLEIPDLENEDWIKNSVSAMEHDGTNMLECIYYYHPITNELRWNVDHLYKGGTQNSRNIVFQIVAEAVSPELLLPAGEVEFNNTITATEESGKQTTDSATGTLARETLKKDVTDDYKLDEASFGNKIPFVIDVNTYGVDMNADGDSLTMIDEPGQYLVFDTESIKVYEYDVTANPGVGYGNIASQANISVTGGKEHPSEGAANLVDGNKNSLYKFFNAAMTSEQTITLSFDSVEEMNRFVIDFENVGASDGNNFAFNYSILAQNSSEDTTTWDTIADHASANRTDNSQQSYVFTTKPYDTIQIVVHSCTANGNPGWPAVAEFAVYAKSEVGENVKNNYANLQFVEVDTSQWNAALETKEDGSEILKITIPDNKWYRIEYMMEYIGPKGETVKVSNNVRWDGRPTESGSEYTNDSFQYDVLGTVIANNYAGINVTKVDENNLRHYLKGAQFSLTQCEVLDDGTIQEIPSTTQIRTTNENGIASFSNTDDFAISNVEPWMEFNTVYCLKEIKAPTGYVLDDTPMYFVVAKQINIDGTMAIPEFPDGVYVYAKDAVYNYTMLNGKGKIEVNKKFFVNEDKESIVQDGTYRFGLFTEENPTTTPSQILSIQIKNGNITYLRDGVTTQTPTFNDIDVGTTTSYYIYELDSQNQPVKDNSYVEIDGANFKVRYPSNDAITVTDEEIPVKEVHNYLTFKLPESGGSGVAWYKLFGFTLILLSVFAIVKRKQKGRRFQNR